MKKNRIVALKNFTISDSIKLSDPVIIKKDIYFLIKI